MSIKKIFIERESILQGHINELKSKLNLLANNEEAIFRLRTEICNKCPLKNGNTCDKKRWIHPTKLTASTIRKTGYVNGCGCRLSAKQRSKKSICPAKFWGGEFDNLS